MNRAQPEFQLASDTQIGTVVLKVANLEKMTTFYHKIIGLSVLSEKNEESTLGTAAYPLLILRKCKEPLPSANKTGLYHTAFLLPTRTDLGNALHHYLQVKAPIIGASDHGYSEALYLTDPEGNGIEVYCDKSLKKWDIREDGEIVGQTIPMDAEGVLAASTGEENLFPEGTIIGHVHLKVADLVKTEAFYTEILGLTRTNDFGSQAKFFAAGSYHHHVGTNSWSGKNLPNMEERDLGLAFFTFRVTSTKELVRIEKHWQKQTVNYQKDLDGQLWITDPNGIQIKIEA